MKNLIFLIIVFCGLLYGEGENQWILAEGRAGIFMSDLDAARDAAIHSALEKALEKYAGLAIDSYSLYSKAMLIDSVFKTHLFGYIEKYELVDSSYTEKEYWVKVKAKVGEKPLLKTLEELAAHHSVLILFREKNFGKPVEGKIIPIIIANPFFSGKVVIPSLQEIKKSKAVSKLPESFFENPEIETVVSIGRRFLCDIVIVGWADTEDVTPKGDDLGYEVDSSVLFPIAYARGNVYVFSIVEKKLVSSHRFDKIKGADNKDIQIASNNALEFLGKEILNKLLPDLTKYLNDKKSNFFVKTRLQDEDLTKLINILKSLRFVEDVEIVNKKSNETILNITFSERERYLYLLIKSTSQIELIDYDKETRTFNLKLNEKYYGN